MYKLLYPTGGIEDPAPMRNVTVTLQESDAGRWIEVEDDDGYISLFIDEIDLLIEHLQAMKRVLNGN